MNYRRRTTRPDAGYYRESRKIRGASSARGGRGGGGGMMIWGVMLVVFAIIALWVFFGR